jgi:hypothetical protein
MNLKYLNFYQLNKENNYLVEALKRLMMKFID